MRPRDATGKASICRRSPRVKGDLFVTTVERGSTPKAEWNRGYAASVPTRYGGLFCFMGANADTFSAVDTPAFIDHRSAVPNTDGFGGTMAQTGGAPRTFFRV